MNRTFSWLLLVALVSPAAAQAIPPIPRILPPEGIEIPADVRTRLQKELATAQKRFQGVAAHPLAPDVEVYLKAVEYALLHREFYNPKDFAKADSALAEANKRIDSLRKGQAPWTKATGLVVRGYRSTIDGSAQPYGMVIPKDHDFKKKLPLYIWLHGRGDKNTDLHFIHDRSTKVGQIEPPNALVVHPFGRQCVGFKSAGERDVLEATEHAQQQYGRAPNQPVLVGFSMGGAGAWHLGAHFAWKYAAISPGAGFAETARYVKLTPEKYPPAYEQTLWTIYDCPNYVRNLFNVPVIAYSGENDKQIQAARVMEEAYLAEGRTLTHLIGPGVEHKYEPKTLQKLLGLLAAEAAKPANNRPEKLLLQTRTLQYPQQGVLAVLRLDEHYQDSRIDAEFAQDAARMTTKNIAGLRLAIAPRSGTYHFDIDGQKIEVQPAANGREAMTLFKEQGVWSYLPPAAAKKRAVEIAKGVLCHGPIDHAFMRPFLVVTPSGKSKNARFQAWMDFELAHFQARWRALMRGDLRIKKDTEVTQQDMDAYSLILWGDGDSNQLIAKSLPSLPLKFADGQWTFDGKTYSGDQFVPAMIYPSPFHQDAPYRNYIVLNSGLTFRENHDRTNSQQNPKLPDWALIDLSQAPDASAPGKIAAAGFFDERWQIKK